MRWICVATAMLLTTSVVQAQNIQRIEIVEHGIYTVEKRACHRDAQGIERCERANAKHAVTTWTIPAQLGLEFGLRYRVVGSPNGSKIAVKRIWLLPEPGFKSPAVAQPIRRLERTDETTIGAATFVSYAFDDTWEMVPGPWVLQFWHGDRKLDEKRFVVKRP